MEKKRSVIYNVIILLFGLIIGGCIGGFVTIFIIRIGGYFFNWFSGWAALGIIPILIVGSGIGAYLFAKKLLRYFSIETPKLKLSKSKWLIIALLGIIWCPLFYIYYTAIHTNWFINLLPLLLIGILLTIIYLYRIRS